MSKQSSKINTQQGRINYIIHIHCKQLTALRNFRLITYRSPASLVQFSYTTQQDSRNEEECRFAEYQRFDVQRYWTGYYPEVLVDVVTPGQDEIQGYSNCQVDHAQKHMKYILCHYVLCFPMSYTFPLDQKISYVLSKKIFY